MGAAPVSPNVSGEQEIVSDIGSKSTEVRSDTLFAELAKWERHPVGHSLGYLNLSPDRLWFVPHARSILARGFDIPLEVVASVERSDNWLWRGAVNIRLGESLRLEVEFLVEPDELVPGMEKRVFCSDTLRLFLGFSRKKFLSMARELGMLRESARR
jgi:hypothetical protein